MKPSNAKDSFDAKNSNIIKQIGSVLASEQSVKAIWERLVSLFRKVPNGDVYGQEGVFFVAICALSLLFWREPGIKFLFVIPIFRLARRIGFAPGMVAAVLAAIVSSLADSKLVGHSALYTGLILNALALLSVAMMAHSLNDRLNQVQNQAETDALTGALNRFGFNRAMTALFEEHRQTKEPMVLAVLDLNDFKMLNDVYGHGFGDNILRALKNCIDPAVAEGGFVGRLGGDEFVVVFENIDLEEARTRIQRAQIRFKRSTIVLGQQATFSFGIVTAPADSSNTETLLQKADADMYNSKACAKAVTGVLPASYAERGA